MLEYPGHGFKAEDLLTFIELEGFADDWKDLKLSDQDLFALQVTIMASPKGHPVVKGTGGLRKIRFAPLKWRRGKSGASRVGYVYLEEWGVVLLVAAYSKKERDDFSPAEKKSIRMLIARVRKQFSLRTIK